VHAVGQRRDAVKVDRSHFFGDGALASTVEIHRARVMEKMGVRSLAHLVRMVMAAEDNNSAQ